MRILVLGAGAVGCFYGARLAAAGSDVVFLARGEQLRALREKGLVVHSGHGDVRLPQVAAVERAAEAGRVDWVICAVKAWQVGQAAAGLGPVLGPDTAVLPLQNGVEASDQLAETLGPRHAVYGTTWIAAQLVEPGVVRHVGVEPRVALGERDGRATPRVTALAEALSRAGVRVEVPDDMLRVLWSKFVFISSLSGVAALTRLPVGEWRHVPDTRRLLVAALEEVAAVGRARGVALAHGVVESTLEFIDALPPSAQPSLARDVVEGKPSELEAQTGAVVRLGSEVGLPTPTHEMIYATLLPQELRARAQK